MKLLACCAAGLLGQRQFGKRQFEFYSVTVTKSTPCKAGGQSHIHCLEPRFPYPSKESVNKLPLRAVTYKYLHSWGDKKKTQTQTFTQDLEPAAYQLRTGSVTSRMAPRTRASDHYFKSWLPQGPAQETVILYIGRIVHVEEKGEDIEISHLKRMYIQNPIVYKKTVRS